MSTPAHDWRVSPTLIESCRLWRAGRIDDDDMAARILRTPRAEPDRMLVGRDIHEILEHHGVPEAGEVTAASGRVVTFAAPDPDHGAAPSEVEVPVRRVLPVPGMGDVLISGRCDLLLPDRIVDHKCSSRTPDTDALHQSWQWRAYLWMTEMEWFQFRLWQWSWSAGPRYRPRPVSVAEPVDMDCRMDVTGSHLAEAVSDLWHCARSLDVERGLRPDYRHPRRPDYLVARRR